MPLRRLLARTAAAVAAAFLLTTASAAAAPAGGPSARPLPYFASLKRDTTNVRIGPGSGYPIRWIYQRASMPVEVLHRYGNWRRIRDMAGDGGWVHASMLSRRRAAVVQARNAKDVMMRSGPAADARVVAILKPDVLVTPQACRNDWCLVTVQGRRLRGHVPQARLWGVYPDEVF